VVVCSASTDPQDPARTLAAGAAAFFAKHRIDWTWLTKTFAT
jgi:hypothetical protein